MDDAIGVLRADFVGAGGHDAPGVRSELARLLEAGLVSATPTAQEPSERVVLLRSARIDLFVSRGDTVEERAVEAGRSLGRRLHDHLRNPAASRECIVYDSVAEYIVDFIVHLLAHRGLDAWHFGALSPHRAGTFSDTVLRLRGAEPDSWPHVVEQLAQRGLLAEVVARADARLRALLGGAAIDVEPPVTWAEGWPLFLAAWRLIDAAIRSGPPDGLGPPAAPTLSEPRAAFARFLSADPERPATWADPTVLGAWIGRAAEWVLRDAEAHSVRWDRRTLEASMAAQPWFDPRPVIEALERGGRDRVVPTTAKSPSAARVGGPNDPMASGPKPPGTRRLAGHMSHRPLNRTRARVLLEALEDLAGGRTSNVGPGQGLPHVPASGISEDALAVVAFLGATITPHATEFGGSTTSPAEPDGREDRAPGATLLRQAQEALTGGERTRLRDAVRALTPSQANTLSSRAVGVLFLARPWIDLGIAGEMSRRGLTPRDVAPLIAASGLIAAGQPDPVVEVLATGSPHGLSAAVDGTGSHDYGSLVRGLRDRATALRVEVPAACDDPAEDLFELGCAQFRQWLRGFRTSSTDFVRNRFLLQPGRLEFEKGGRVIVHRPSTGFDMLLTGAGYCERLDRVPWWTAGGLEWRS